MFLAQSSFLSDYSFNTLPFSVPEQNNSLINHEYKIVGMGLKNVQYPIKNLRSALFQSKKMRLTFS